MNADPIAWLGRQQTGWPPVASACPIKMLEWKQKGWIIEPLYAAPPAQAVDLVPPGWTIKRDGAKLRIVSPEDGPGFVAWEPYHVHSFEQRMLYALAQELIGEGVKP